MAQEAQLVRRIRICDLQLLGEDEATDEDENFIKNLFIHVTAHDYLLFA